MSWRGGGDAGKAEPAILNEEVAVIVFGAESWRGGGRHAEQRWRGRRRSTTNTKKTPNSQTKRINAAALKKAETEMAS
jgi:hypothetical protein